MPGLYSKVISRLCATKHCRFKDFAASVSAGDGRFADVFGIRNHLARWPDAGPEVIQGAALGRDLRRVYRYRPPAPRSHPHRLPARLRHDSLEGVVRVLRSQEEDHPL